MDHLFDLIDWGSDKGLEKCYCFTADSNFAPNVWARKKIEDGAEKILKNYRFQSVGSPYNHFWLEFPNSINRRSDSDSVSAMWCQYKNEDMTMWVNFYEHHNGEFNGFNQGVFVHLSKDMRPLQLEVAYKPQNKTDYLVDDLISNIHTIAVDALHPLIEIDIIFLFEFLRLRTERDMIHHTPKRQQQRKAARKGNLPLNEYYELTKYPKGKHPSRSVSSGNKSQGLNRHHSVMGNWAYYSPDSPMLGHTSGWVWRPAHMRGNKRRGTIDKDYVVKDSAI